MGSESKPQHTPAPWEVLRDEDGRAFGATCGKYHIAITGLQPNHEADAHLIAAAPCLLSALQRLRSRFDALLAQKPVRDAAETRGEVDAALNKALGKE